MRCIVTGGSGALGAAVCVALADAGHSAVSYDLAPPELPGVEWFRGDIRDGMAMIEAARSADAIVHLASMLATESKTAPRLAVEVNCVGMANALETARILEIKRFVWASSAGVYGLYPGDVVIANDAPYRPPNVYGATKVLNELLAQHYFDAHGIETVGLRFTLMMGTGKPRGLSGLLSTALIDKPVMGEPARVPYGDDAPNWLWIEDAARAVLLAATGRATKTRSFNICGEVRPMTDAVAIIQNLLPGASLELEPGAWGLEHHLDTAPIETELGFTPQWGLEKQLAELVRRAELRRESGTASNVD